MALFVSSFKNAIRKGWQAAIRNRIPGLFIWCTGLAFIVGYYYLPSVQKSLEALGEFKLTWSWRFSMVSTAIFGGLIPSLVTLFTAKPRQERIESQETQTQWLKPGSTAEYLLANTLLWAYKGLEIDYFYQFQGWVFGNQSDVQTVLTKTLCDQFVMVPIIGMTNVVLFYHWRECGYSFRKAWGTLGNDWYGRLVLPPLIANWFVWVPAVAMIYCLPAALQLPVQNLILCFWVLILLVYAQPDEQAEKSTES